VNVDAEWKFASCVLHSGGKGAHGYIYIYIYIRQVEKGLTDLGVSHRAAQQFFLRAMGREAMQAEMQAGCVYLCVINSCYTEFL
jgi:hypothetical protein